jgi:hypothetical protein
MATSPMDQRWGYNTLTPQAGQVYIGSQYGAPGGQYSGGAGQVPIPRNVFYDVAAVKSNYNLLSADAHAALAAQAAAAQGRSSVPDSWVHTHYEKMVDLAAQIQNQYGARVTPLDAYDWYRQNIGATGSYGAKSGGGGSGGGGGGGGSGGVSTSHSTSTSLNMTDPDTARGLVDQALSQYIGRKATTQEQQAFMQALKVHEQKNAGTTTTDSTTVSDGSGNSNTTSSSTGTGGFNAQQFAQEYAAGNKGAAEYQAATTYLDEFIKTISQPKVSAL